MISPVPSGFVRKRASPGRAPFFGQIPSGLTVPTTASPYFGSASRIVCPPASSAPEARSRVFRRASPTGGEVGELDLACLGVHGTLPREVGRRTVGIKAAFVYRVPMVRCVTRHKDRRRRKSRRRPSGEKEEPYGSPTPS